MEHRCEGSVLECVEIFKIEADDDYWMIKLPKGPYKALEFVENIKWCPWCDINLNDPCSNCAHAKGKAREGKRYYAPCNACVEGSEWRVLD